MNNTERFAPVFVYKKSADGSKPTLVATFLTYYRARKFALRRLSQEPKAKGVQWIIGTSQPGRNDRPAAVANSR